MLQENNSSKPNRTYKDGVFKLLFKEPAKSAELFQALTGVECKPEDITVITLEDALAKNFLNDLAFVAKGRTLLICEHQSTWSDNMPLRLLIYLGRLYEKYFGLHESDNKKLLHGSKRLMLPRPEFIVLYNGNAPLKSDELLLSDAYIGGKSNGIGSIEMVVPVIDINKERDSELLARCDTLGQYSDFISTVKWYKSRGQSLRAAIEDAIKDCKQRGILVEFLTEHGGAIVSILETEFKLEDRDWVMREEGRDSMAKISKLYFLQRKTAEEIAEILGLSLNEVETAIEKLQ